METRIIEGLDRLGRPADGWEPLAGDASVRRYFRSRSEVLMDTGEPFVEAEDPFCLTARFLGENGLPVPAVRAVDGGAGLALLEDLGDETLEFCSARTIPESLYEEAVDLLAGLQRIDVDNLAEHLPARRLFFDEEKLLWELRFFHRHFFTGLLALTLPAEEEQAMQEFYLDLCTRVAGQRPRVFCHRDFHSRNLMVTPRGLVMVDFQDARLGPETYDLVSLLRDCYVDIGAELEERLIERYLRLRPTADQDGGFRRRLELTALQRGIKAAGTFSFQAVEQNNRRYLESMPLTARHIGRAVAALPEYAEPASLLLSRLISFPG